MGIASNYEGFKFTHHGYEFPVCVTAVSETVSLVIPSSREVVSVGRLSLVFVQRCWHFLSIDPELLC